MTDIRFEFVKCRQPMEADPELAGSEVRCPQCMEPITVPPRSNRPPHTDAFGNSSHVGLAWRRVTAASVDMLLLIALSYAATRVTGMSMVGALIAWFIFFGSWLVLNLKYGTTLGKALAGIVCRYENASGDRSLQLLICFAVTWLPVMAITLVVIEIDPRSGRSWPGVIIALGIVWYVVSLVVLLNSKGTHGIQDMISNTRIAEISDQPLSISRKYVLWACFAILLVFAAGEIPDDTGGEHGGSGAGVVPPSDGIPLETLKLTAHTVLTYWRELDFIADDEGGGTGTAFAVARDGNRLRLVTNSHVLDLESLARSDDLSDSITEINQYVLEIEFATGKRARVLRFADRGADIDLAFLEVDSSGLLEGRDYVLLTHDRFIGVKIGDDAVAVGSPRGLAGTHTFGKISAIRPLDDANRYRVIQTDAAINPGNSGGPLFVKRGNTFKWVGVNTFVIGSDNLGFAVDAAHVLEGPYNWVAATPHGAAETIRKFYERDAGVE